MSVEDLGAGLIPDNSREGPSCELITAYRHLQKIGLEGVVDELKL